MSEVVAMALDEELLEQRRALAAARGLALHHLPSLPIKMIGKQSGLPLGRAENINKDIDQRRLQATLYSSVGLRIAVPDKLLC